MASLVPRLSIVVPCYNESLGLKSAYDRIVKATERCVERDFELVLVNDGSTDRTWDVICQLAKLDLRVRGFSLSRNYGQEIAVTCGISQARGERVLLIDADLQDPPELLREMMAKMNEGYDVVYGRRRRRANETRIKLLTAAMFYRTFGYLTGDLQMPVDTGDFRLMSRRIVDCFKQLAECQRFNRGLISWIGFKQTAVLYDRDPRFAGETHMTMSKMLRLATDAITGFSFVPLRFATQIGFLAFGVSTLLGLYAIISWLSGQALQGWFSLIATMIFFGSIQLLVLGIIGEYIGRVLVESKRRPLYFISDVIDGRHEAVELLRAAE